jgi:hypothetical protein
MHEGAPQCNAPGAQDDFSLCTNEETLLFVQELCAGCNEKAVSTWFSNHFCDHGVYEHVQIGSRGIWRVVGLRRRGRIRMMLAKQQTLRSQGSSDRTDVAYDRLCVSVLLQCAIIQKRFREYIETTNM